MTTQSDSKVSSALGASSSRPRPFHTLLFPSARLPAFFISLAVLTSVVGTALGIAAATIPLSSNVSRRCALASAVIAPSALYCIVCTPHLMAVALPRFLRPTPMLVIDHTIVVESDPAGAMLVQIYVRRSVIPAPIPWSALRNKHCAAAPIDPDSVPIDPPGGVSPAGRTTQLLPHGDAAGSVHAAIDPVPAFGLTRDAVRQRDGGKQHECDC